eukprot:scaffold7737_cov24-Prasinocladus_malaysianus.AAC.1
MFDELLAGLASQQSYCCWCIVKSFEFRPRRQPCQPQRTVRIVATHKGTVREATSSRSVSTVRVERRSKEPRPAEVSTGLDDGGPTSAISHLLRTYTVVRSAFQNFRFLAGKS